MLVGIMAEAAIVINSLSVLIEVSKKECLLGKFMTVLCTTTILPLFIGSTG